MIQTCSLNFEMKHRRTITDNYQLLTLTDFGEGTFCVCDGGLLTIDFCCICGRSTVLCCSWHLAAGASVSPVSKKSSKSKQIRFYCLVIKNRAGLFYNLDSQWQNIFSCFDHLLGWFQSNIAHFYFSLQHIPFKMSKFFIREINVSQLIYIQYFRTQKVVYIADICHWYISCRPCLNFCTQQQ